MATLKRSLSIPVLTLYGLGNILGAGIYVLIGKVAGAAGMSTPLAFLIAMAVAGFTAFSYMELASRFPKSAGSALYTFQAFKRKWLSLAIGLSLILAGITSAAALSIGFAGYLASIVDVPIVVASVGVILLLTAVTLVGISESAKVAVAFTVVEAFGLLLIIWLGRNAIGTVSATEMFTLDSTVGFSGLMAGSLLAFYAFIGFEDMVNVSEEAKDPRRSMPYAIVGALFLAAIMYSLIVVVSISVMSPAELAASNAPLSSVLERVSSINPVFMSVIGMAAAFNGIIVQIIMGSRMLYGLSTMGWLHKSFTQVHKTRNTPVLATLTVGALMLAGTLLLPLVSLAQATSYMVLIVFFIVNVSLLFVKLRRKPIPKNVVTVPLALPVLGAFSSIAVVIYQLVQAV